MLSAPLQAVDRLLNGITMYRLVLYGLVALALIAVLLGTLHRIAFGPLSFLGSLTVLLPVCYGANCLLARWVNAPVNAESWSITALILFFIMLPVRSAADAGTLLLAGVIAMASKYVIAIRGKHLFNPAAFAATAVGPFTGSAIWWVGTPWLLPFTMVLGFLIIRKIRRGALFWSCVLCSMGVLIPLALMNGVPLAEALRQHLVSWPIIFFASVMLTEPMTMPPRRHHQVLYGGLAGVLHWPFRIGPLFSSPELILLLVNLCSWTVSLRRRVFLRLLEKREIARDTWEFSFAPDAPLAFRPGQYLEWTLPNVQCDARGNRRFFTIASAPTEPQIRIGVRIGPRHSMFKERLRVLEPGAIMVANALAGDFVLPDDLSVKMVFIAGGIGVTPFRSMVRWLMDRQEHRDIVVFLLNRTPEDVAYREVFDAASSVGVRTTYVYSDSTVPLPTGSVRSLDAHTLAGMVPDYPERVCYLSGPGGMVDAYVRMLRTMGIPRHRIRTDYFPGL